MDGGLGRSSSTQCSALQTTVDQFTKGVSPEQVSLQALAMEACFVEALLLGLTLCMLPHYSVQPTGKETGDYVVIDLGGSTLRVAVIAIRPESAPVVVADSPPTCAPHLIARRSDASLDSKERVRTVVSKQWVVANANKVVDAAFFETIASKVRETLEEQDVIALQDTIKVGVTWSFPLETTSYNSAKILLMGKGYELAPELRGADLKGVLEGALLDKEGIRIEVEAVVNDSFAVYAAGRFLDSNTGLALVLGTGFNMCYQLSTAPELHLSKTLADEPNMLFNTEMSFFGVDLVKEFATKYDLCIDSRFLEKPTFKPHMSVDPSLHSIFQPCELLSSGRYIVELIRLVFVDLMDEGELFINQQNRSAILTPYESITGEFISLLVELYGNHAECATQIEQYFNWSRGLVTESDVAKVEAVVRAVVQRSAAVVSVAIIASIKLLIRFNGPFTSNEVTIGYVGAVIERLHCLREGISSIVNSSTVVKELGVRIHLKHVRDSSLVGGAIAAACHVPLRSL